MKDEMYSIKENGFTNVKWYDADLNFTYYDALMNGEKVEIRTSKDKIEWRYLGGQLEDIEWYSLKVKEEAQTENNTEEQPTYPTQKEIVGEIKKSEQIKINILVTIEKEKDLVVNI